MGAWSYRRVEPVKFRAFFGTSQEVTDKVLLKNHRKMYNKNVAITGSTIEKTAKYDQFKEDKIRMELYRIILSLYNEGYRTFTCNPHSYIGLLGADTIVMLREAGKCLEIILSVAIPETAFSADTDKVYHALYDDLIKQADNKKILPEKEFFGNALVGGHIICYYDDFSTEMQLIYASGTSYTNIRKMI